MKKTRFNNLFKSSKKKSIWYWIFIGWWLELIILIFLLYFWLLKFIFVKLPISLFKKNKKKEIVNNTQQSPVIVCPVAKISFKVAGITFEGRQDVIKKMVKDAISEGIIEPYDGMTNREIIECGYDVYETENVKLKNIRLEPTEFEGKDAIEIYTEHLVDEEQIMVGYVPKKQVQEVLSLMEQFNTGDYKLKVDALLVGGKCKVIEYDEEKDKDYIVSDEREFGIKIELSLFEK